MPRKRQSNSADESFGAIFKTPWPYLIVAVTAMGFFVWSLVPSWENKNTYKINTELERIESLKKSDLAASYEAWESLQAFVKGQKLTNAKLKKKLNDTANDMVLIYPEVMDVINEKKLQEEQKRQRVAEEKREIEELDALRKKYKRVDQTAKDALSALKRLEAFTEVGVNKLKYSEALGVAWGDVKIFVESPQGQGEYNELSDLLKTAMNHFKNASDHWDQKYTVQEDWREASKVVSTIDKLLNQ